ncbi:cytochrome-c peroxidase [Amylibacter sp.]|jgi:cytochrome c peroxidase|nr:cytochrome-c peroxidase [Rhodobacterales bacterium]MDA7739483.1 cytochrome-c peroxidase [Amylibacter sp.]MBT4323318.1 cytochrome-c peroxidase [Rhodobacterales bacterium]MBT4471198.1 cytochrome-c peroxidase [Rhodobacterales bacterium]MBT6009166.1 cytochrome-c peroxidase [Rhodobacterales bacterium]
MRFLATVIFIFTSLDVSANKLPLPLNDSDYRSVDENEAKLGQLLFYDPILSGNKEVACATCHHPSLGTGDGLSLSLGDGGKGLGNKRIVDYENLPEQRVPRNAQPLFNLGAKQFKTLFHDGRVQVDLSRPSGLRTPLEEEMVEGFSSIISAQTMFPVLSADEMAGHYSENEISEAVRRGTLTGEGGAWDLISKRVGSVPAYSDFFIDIYDHIEVAKDIKFTDISNAVAAFMEFEWRSDTSPFDDFLQGKINLNTSQENGMELFYGKANCSSCHAGALFTDHQFHATGQPQVGPGKAARFQSHSRDLGRFRVTGNIKDKYAFRTPSLRNVELTGPWGHAGAYNELEAFLGAHIDPYLALSNYDKSNVTLTKYDTNDWKIMDDASEVKAIADAISIKPVIISEGEVTDLLAFLGTLTDTKAQKGRLGIPETVPSGLKIPNPQ